MANYEHKGPSGWEQYSAEHNQQIAVAINAGHESVQLTGIPFEVRFGASAVSEKVATPPSGPDVVGLQVNLNSQNSRVVSASWRTTPPYEHKLSLIHI